MYDNRISRALTTCLALGLVLMIADVARTGIPQKINYQGRITDNVTGEPLAGVCTMVFGIYDSAEDGALLWSEEQVVGVDSSGVFSVILGSQAPVGISLGGPWWLEIEVNGQVLLPRREIVSVPFALHSANSDSLDGLSPDSFSLVGHGHEDYVTEGEAASITGEMIADAEIADSDIAEDAAIDPSKIDGTAWTHDNDGAGSGLDADRLDGLEADAFADSGHTHDGRYYRQTELNSAGSINQGSNPVDWTKLKNVPGGFADGTDDVGGAGDGHSLDAAGGGSIDVVYVNEDGDVGISTTEPAAALHVRGGFRVGNPEAGYNAVLYGQGTGSRLYWNAPKGALRAGTDMGGGYWSDARVGEYSVAFGQATEASGTQSFAVGRLAEAAAHTAVAMGDYTQATGDYSFAAGGHAKARDEKAVALGWHAEADAANAVAIGEYVEAEAANSFVLGSGEGTLSALRNTTENSLIVGFDDTEPIVFVGGSSGFVGIGTTEPEAYLHVERTVKIGPEGYAHPTGGWGLMIIAQSSTHAAKPLSVKNTDGEWILMVTGDRKIGCGTATPLARFHLQDTDIGLDSDALHVDIAAVEAADAILGLYSGEGGTGGSGITFGEIAGGALVDKWAIVRETTGGGDSGLRITYGANHDQFQNSIMMYLDDAGNVGIGTKTFGSDRLKVAGSACATAWNTCSDLKFKTDIERIEGALDKVSNLSGVRFRWKTEDCVNRGFPEGKHYGVIAQEAEVVLPEIVNAGPDGERSVAYAEIVPILIESIKELRAENLALAERIEALEGARD